MQLKSLVYKRLAELKFHNNFCLIEKKISSHVRKESFYQISVKYANIVIVSQVNMKADTKDCCGF